MEYLGQKAHLSSVRGSEVGDSTAAANAAEAETARHRRPIRHLLALQHPPLPAHHPAHHSQAFPPTLCPTLALPIRVMTKRGHLCHDTELFPANGGGNETSPSESPPHCGLCTAKKLESSGAVGGTAK